MVQDADHLELDRQRLIEAKQKGGLVTLATFVKLSGPGWLQSAITLGGGSLASSLYLGVLAGFSLLWLQPLAMVFGVIMLSAIAYVTLATGQRPFRAINDHVNPVLGWGWIIATMMANLVWALPQFALGTAAMKQNLLPAGAFGDMTATGSNAIVAGTILVLCIVVIIFYNSGSWGIRLFEGLLKVMVGIIVICFVVTVLKMALGGGELPWGLMLQGLVPNPRLLWEPAETFNQVLDATGSSAAFWSDLIVKDQRQVIISTVGTAVGINMTFLLPYSMLARGWDRNFRSLAIFDLSTALLIPFILATGCIVIASASQFHAQYHPGLLGEPNAAGIVEAPPANLKAGYDKLILRRLAHGPGAVDLAQIDDEQKQAALVKLPLSEKRMAAMLVRRDAGNLAKSLEQLTGSTFSHWVFGIGVVGMAISTIIILMLINGFVFCEMFNLPPRGYPHIIGCLMVSVGAMGPFIWKGTAKFWLAVPTSVFGFSLLPIAYVTFLLLMNQKSLLGDAMPRGGRRWRWNILMSIATCFAVAGSLWAIWHSAAGMWGVVGFGAFVLLALIVHVVMPRKAVKV